MIDTMAKAGEAFAPALTGPEKGALPDIEGHCLRLRRFVYRLLGEAAEADALAERVLLTVLRGRRYAVGENFAVTMYRLTLAMAARSERAPAVPDQGGAAPLRAVLQRLFQLPLQQRAAVLMHKYEKLGAGEIAAVLGTSEAAARRCVLAGYRALSGEAGSYNE